MRSRSFGRVRRSLLVLLAAGCFVMSGALTAPAQGKEAKDPAAKRGRKGGKKKGQDAPGAGGKKKARRGKSAAIRLAMLNDKRVESLYSKLDADSSGSVTLEEFKALPTVLEEMAKEAAAKAKARAEEKKAPAGEDPAKKRKGGRRKKKDPSTQ